MASTPQATHTNASIRLALINETVTGPPAEALLQECGLLNAHIHDIPPVRMLDHATGIGTLIFRLLARNQNLQIERLVGADIDENYLKYFEERAEQAGYSIEALRLDQQNPGLGTDTFTHVFNNFGVFFASDEAAVLRETLRVLRPGGLAGFTSWAKITWWDEIALPALARYIPDAPPLPHASQLFGRTGWMNLDSTRTKLDAAGFVDTASQIFSFTPKVEPADFAAACAHLVKTITSRAWSQEDQVKHESEIEEAILKHLHDSYEFGRWTGRMPAILTWGRKADASAGACA